MQSRIAVLGSVAVAAVATLALPAAASARARASAVANLHLVEHATTNTVVDVGAAGASTGDLLTFHNELFDQRDRRKVASNQGFCVRIDPAAASWECSSTTFFKKGQITTQGPYYDGKGSVLAVTGGTGKFKNSRGQLVTRPLSDVTKRDLIYRLEGFGATPIRPTV